MASSSFYNPYSSVPLCPNGTGTQGFAILGLLFHLSLLLLFSRLARTGNSVDGDLIAGTSVFLNDPHNYSVGGESGGVIKTIEEVSLDRLEGRRKSKEDEGGEDMVLHFEPVCCEV